MSAFLSVKQNDKLMKNRCKFQLHLCHTDS